MFRDARVLAFSIFAVLKDVRVSAASILVRPRCREPLPPQTTGDVCRAKTKTAPSNRFGSLDACEIDAVFRLAVGSDRREPGHVGPFASERISAVLEMEIAKGRSAQHRDGPWKIDSRYGNKQSDLGRGTDLR